MITLVKVTAYTIRKQMEKKRALYGKDYQGLQQQIFIDQGAKLGTVNRCDSARAGEEFWRADELTKDNDKDARKKEKVSKTRRRQPLRKVQR